MQVLEKELGFEGALVESRETKVRQFVGDGGYAKIEKATLEDGNVVCTEFAIAHSLAYGSYRSPSRFIITIRTIVSPVWLVQILPILDFAEFRIAISSRSPKLAYSSSQ